MDQFDDKLWLSYTQEKYDPIKKNTPYFWTGITEYWNWDNCRLSLIPIGDGKARIVARRRKQFDSKFRRKKVSVDLMISVIVTGVEEPEVLTQRIDGNNIPENHNHSRKAIRLTLENDLRGDDRPLVDCHIWQLQDDDKGERTIEKLYKSIKATMAQPAKPEHDVIFDTDVPSSGKVIPVIYQPRLDVLKNFLREVQLKQKKEEDTLEVILVFNNEHLMKHWFLDHAYRLIRLLIYLRIFDVESFKVRHQDKFATHINFENIHSGEHVLYYDNIHEDKPPAADRKVRHWHVSKNHPIVFVNTANHAMAEFDTNHAHWKWEYIPWDEDGPINLIDESGT